MVDIKSFDISELTEYITASGQNAFRAKQLYEWMHVHLARSFDDMSNIPKSLREKLKAECVYTALKIQTVQVSKLDETRKYLFELSDGNYIEAVFMRYRHGNSVCISSQVGCRMGCRFCASTLNGLVRSLTASEMLDQIYSITLDTGMRISNVVVMGIGEPLDNFDNLIRFIRMISDEKGLNISQRNITVSTCGIVPNILRLAKLDLKITLALSLHAATDEKRMELMPVAKTYSIDEITDACKKYFDMTGRRISFEYALVKDQNDSDEDTVLLAELARKCHAHVNLIPVNPVRERKYRRPSGESIVAFKNKLEKNGINVTIRRELGSDIDGACGQLRLNAQARRR